MNETLTFFTDMVTMILPFTFLLFAFFYDRGGFGLFNIGKPRIYPIGKGVWRTSPLGRMLMFQKFMLAALFGTITAVRILGEFPGSDWLRFGVYTGILVSAVFFLKTLMNVQNEKNKKN